jgi:PrtD family type I secretion system ABC transporter
VRPAAGIAGHRIEKTLQVIDVSKPDPTTIKRVLLDERRSFLGALGFSLAINLLGLTSSIYMLQIYDRVLSSYSIETLVVLSLMAAVAYVTLAGLEALRSSLLQRVGARVAHRLGSEAFQIQLRGSGGSDTPSLQPLRDVDTIRNIVGGPAAAALFDLPWSPIYFILLYFLSPVLFAITVVVGVLLAAIAYLNDRVNKDTSASAAKDQLKALQFAETAARGGEAILAMGEGQTIAAHWLTRSRNAVKQSLAASERESGFHSAAKFLRNFLQTALLGVGAGLTIVGELSSGGIIAGSILGTRALAPVEAVIGAWKAVLGARQAWTRLDTALAMLSGQQGGMPLPKPKGALACEGVSIVPTGAQRPILAGVNFSLQAGETLAVVGPSGTGKSTLTRAFIGLVAPYTGSIRLDGADVVAWQKTDLGKWIGYLPQSPALLAGTVAENISQFSITSTDEIIAAAECAGVHEIILKLPKGYDTDVGPGGLRLSGGQLQRIALARALLGNRPLIVLDEPESHLDTEGEGQLRNTMQRLKAKGTTLIIVSHRPSAIAAADKLLILRDGRAEFGPREEILNGIMRASAQPTRRRGPRWPPGDPGRAQSPRPRGAGLR